MTSFLILVATFLTVYLLAPWLAVMMLYWLPLDHPERIQTGVSILTTIAVYSILRRYFGRAVPPV